jgi:hypothetical protein
VLSTNIENYLMQLNNSKEACTGSNYSNEDRNNYFAGVVVVDLLLFVPNLHGKGSCLGCQN